MKLTRSTMRRGLLGVFATGALGAAAATMGIPAADAQPAPCTAAGLASTVSSVTGAAGQYLDTHQDVNDALTSAGSQTPSDAEGSLRGYFAAHPQEFNDLRGIAAPLTNLRSQCNANVSTGQISALLQAFA
ncbi:heme-binding protein [Mycobacterium sp.]|uniref:heme-binding protein n=1 Tax=Mycobacterium sp. TaxID=1785 RepID=UPI002C226330|nr:heme-binding protein [Mycobacterium sp.]HME48917.1 heme-binding protein [Mycobacterium sp.]